MGDKELTTWIGNLITFLIFALIQIKIVKTPCFNTSEIIWTGAGMLIVLLIHLINLRN